MKSWLQLFSKLRNSHHHQFCSLLLLIIDHGGDGGIPEDGPSQLTHPALVVCKNYASWYICCRCCWYNFFFTSKLCFPSVSWFEVTTFPRLILNLAALHFHLLCSLKIPASTYSIFHLIAHQTHALIKEIETSLINKSIETNVRSHNLHTKLNVLHLTLSFHFMSLDLSFNFLSSRWVLAQWQSVSLHGCAQCKYHTYLTELFSNLSIQALKNPL